MSCGGGNGGDFEFNPELFGRGGNDHLSATCPWVDLIGGEGDDSLHAVGPFPLSRGVRETTR